MARKQLYWVIKVTRIAVSWGTMVWPLGFLLYFLILGGVITPQKLEGTVVMAFLQAVVVPVVSWAKSIITMRVAYQRWDFLILGLGLAAFFARLLVVTPLESAERWAQPRRDSSLGFTRRCPQGPLMPRGHQLPGVRAEGRLSAV